MLAGLDHDRAVDQPWPEPAQQPVLTLAGSDASCWACRLHPHQTPGRDRHRSHPGRTTGYILTRFADKYGRPVSLVYPGGSPPADGAAIRVTAAGLRESTNYQLIAAGLAYPTYYSKLYPDLRRALTTAARKARTTGAGLAPADLTTAGVEVTGPHTLTDRAVIMPKLFRRLMDHFALGAGDLSLVGFTTFLAVRDDRLLILPTGHLTGLTTSSRSTSSTSGSNQ